MTDRTVLKKIFQCSENGIDFISNLDEDIFDAAWHMAKENNQDGITMLEELVIAVKYTLVDKLDQLILMYGKDEDESDHAITVKGMCPYDDFRCEILPDDTPIIYLKQREVYERKFSDDIIAKLEMMTKIRFEDR